jgi:hopanoid biosynthesis associated protein HpnK
MKRLIVNADDFGLTEGVNRGIVKAFRQGIVTSTTLIACGRAFDHAVLLARENGGLATGVHLTLVEEKPVSRAAEVPSLVSQNGNFHRDYASIAGRLLTGRLRMSEVRQEFRSQIEKCLAHGIVPTHLDSHQHLHVLPGMADTVIGLAREYRIPAARCPDEKSFPMKGGRSGFNMRELKRMALAWMAGRAGKKFQRNGISTTDRFYGMSCSGHLNREIIANLLKGLPAGTSELGCHPGVLDPEMTSRYAHWGYRWEEELEALTDPAVRALIEQLGIQMINFHDLVSGRPAA